MLSSASARSSSTLLICSTYAVPASVRLTRRVVRVSSAVPSDASSASIRRVTDEVATPRRWAALEKPPASATSSNVVNATSLSTLLAPLSERCVARNARLLCERILLTNCNRYPVRNLLQERAVQAIEISVNYDFICPWCWIGHLNLASGIRAANLPVPVSIQYVPFELTPRCPSTEWTGANIGRPSSAAGYARKGWTRRSRQRA